MTKIYQQSKFHITCLQIIYQLPFMFLLQILNRFQFYDNRIFNNHISNIMTYLFTLIIDIN